MTAPEGSAPIRWRLHLAASPADVFDYLATDEGRAQFWAESAVERSGAIEFRFPSGMALSGKILANQPPRRWAVEYFGGTAQCSNSRRMQGAGRTSR